MIRPSKGKNYHLTMTGSNPEWLIYKMNELDDIFPNKKLFQQNKGYKCNSACLESLTEIHSLLYKDNKRSITMKVLDPLIDISIAVWYLDGGGKTGRNKKNAYLNTTRLGEESTKVVCDYFCQLNMHCTTHESNGRFRVIFSIVGTHRLFKTISHRFPEFMCHRI